jgi:hypothetical protein
MWTFRTMPCVAPAQMNGEDMSTLHMLRHTLKKAFEFVDAEDVPRLLRRHERKYELVVMETSAWSRHAAC